MLSEFLYIIKSKTISHNPLLFLPGAILYGTVSALLCTVHQTVLQSTTTMITWRRWTNKWFLRPPMFFIAYMYWNIEMCSCIAMARITITKTCTIYQLYYRCIRYFLLQNKFLYSVNFVWVLSIYFHVCMCLCVNAYMYLCIYVASLLSPLSHDYISIIFAHSLGIVTRWK